MDKLKFGGKYYAKSSSKIKKIGVPPEGFADSEKFASEEPLDLWDDYQAAVDSISQPITWEEAQILIKCCPTDKMAGIEWTTLHSIESCGSDLIKTLEGVEKYKNLINECNSDMMKEMLLERLEPYVSNHF